MSEATIIHGDCLDVLPTIEAESVDAIITDPPYINDENGVDYNHVGVARRMETTCSVTNPWGYSLDWIGACARFTPQHWIIFCNYAMIGGIYTAISQHARVAAMFVWKKSNAPNAVRPVPRMDCEFIVWAKHPKADCGRMREFKSLVLDVPMPQAGCVAGERLIIPGTGKALHPCQKPLAVVLPFVTWLFTEPGKVILDPFAGTGTTGVACCKAGHKAILIESDSKYLPALHRRLADAATPMFDLCPED